MKIDLHIGESFETFINWLTDNFAVFFDAISDGVKNLIELLENGLAAPSPLVMILILAAVAWYANGWKKWGFPLFSIIGFLIVYSMGLWEYLIQTMALVFVSTFIALLIGVPLGIVSGRNKKANAIIRPCLDFMQTMPAFVYLIPAVLFFQLGKVPGVMATVIFAMPPAVRLTSLGLLQVPDEVMEASVSYGSTTAQQLLKVQLPVALPSILAGINQTIMLALSMVVIAAMIGAGGLGNQVLKGITQLKIGLGFESGVAIVILAIYLDRVTQAIGNKISKV
ncbi:MAG: ABC transporter permease [Sedimentisphaeraceae bacterium JB056]